MENSFRPSRRVPHSVALTRLTGSESPLVNAGTLKLDEKSTINVNGNYTQGSNATFYLEIGGDDPNPDFHQLNASGTASLAGTLNVRFGEWFYSRS